MKSNINDLVLEDLSSIGNSLGNFGSKLGYYGGRALQGIGNFGNTIQNSLHSFARSHPDLAFGGMAAASTLGGAAGGAMFGPVGYAAGIGLPALFHGHGGFDRISNMGTNLVNNYNTRNLINGLQSGAIQPHTTDLSNMYDQMFPQQSQTPVQPQ